MLIRILGKQLENNKPIEGNRTMLILIIKVFICLIAAKSIIIGSEFNFHYWFKYGKKYTTWYDNRPTYKDYLESKQ